MSLSSSRTIAGTFLLVLTIFISRGSHAYAFSNLNFHCRRLLVQQQARGRAGGAAEAHRYLHLKSNSCSSLAHIPIPAATAATSAAAVVGRNENRNGRLNQNSVVSLSMNSSTNGDVNGDEKQPKKWRKLATKLNPIKLLLRLLYQISKIGKTLNTTQSNIRTKFTSLSKKGKLVFSIQLMTLMVIFGAGTNQLWNSVVGSRVGGAGVGVGATAVKSRVLRSRSRPVEVPYSGACVTIYMNILFDLKFFIVFIYFTLLT